MNLKDLYTALLAKTSAGEDLVLATIVAEIGCSPRSAGAHMLVNSDGRVCGTIGGGTVEYQSVAFAQNLLKQRQSQCETYRSCHNNGKEAGTVCDGNVEVYFQFIRGHDEKTAALMKRCLAALEQDGDVWLFTDLTDPDGWRMGLYSADGKPEELALRDDEIHALARNNGVMITSGSRKLYGEPINFAGKVYIFGGGHCAQALQPVLTTVGFRCVVFDNRKEYLTREIFPTACDLIVGDYERLDKTISVGERDYIVIMTHAADVAILRQVLPKNCAYIGCIGSKATVAHVKGQLTRDGASEETISKINTPIGLPIHSETPEEIAISIAGELILRRAEIRAAGLAF